MLFRRANCEKREDVLQISFEEFQKPISEKNSWMKSFLETKKYRPTGPRFEDGSINWQCSCMAGGSLVAHRCGHYFRTLYTCMSSEENADAAVKCPNQFVDWVACMQNLPTERREQMRQAMLSETEPLSVQK
ncbi:unnamed protein product [Caenorhabditis auriculariae]|uniref:CHCH domain-containing protein n=1 Tax=Caenorhabditis auriculariae TaxID=2777116 RepID=A0A8S1HT95_9PELO|nr:unnamed protein product [Caenorhabditis auriculariae]